MTPILRAAELDRADPVAAYVKRFASRDDWVFLDGNSVGAMPVGAAERAHALIDDWTNLRRCGWSKREWLDRPAQIGDAVARLIGAGPGEVTACDSTTLNLYKAASHAVALNPERNVILTQTGNFPTDLFVLQGLVKASGGRLRIEHASDEEDALAKLDDQVAVVSFCHVDYRSGYRWDMARINKAARAVGAINVWDLSHSAGVISVDVNAMDCDFVFGCGYKYLSFGPGGPAYIYGRSELIDATWPAIAGWMGHVDIFAFADDFEPHPGVKAFLTATPMVGANELASAAAEIWAEVDPKALWEKHRSLSEFAVEILQSECAELGVELNSPAEYAKRGGHISFKAPGAGSVVEALLDRGVVGSYRNPDSIRFGLSPLSLRHADVALAVGRLKDVLETEAWRDPKYAKVSV